LLLRAAFDDFMGTSYTEDGAMNEGHRTSSTE